MENILSTAFLRRRYLFFVAFFLLIFAPCAGIAQDTRAIQVTPDQEKRSLIQEVDGYAFLSEDMTLSEIRATAFANAKKQAVQMARTFIKSKTKIENFVLKSSKITATAEGAVRILEQKDHGVVENSRYHVWIKAEVEYSLGPTGDQSGQKADSIQAGPLTVKVWTSKKEYKQGENIEIFVQGNRDFYARIVDITSNGQIVQLLPNAFRRLNYFKSGKIYKIPDEGDHFDLKVSPPFGQDQIVVYASEVPLGAVEMEPVGKGLSMFKGDKKAFESKTRGISVLGSGQKAAAGAEFYEAAWTLTTGN